MLKIAVAGAGYVGLSIACLLASDCEVTLVDVVPEKIDAVNAGKSPIEDAEIHRYLGSGELNLSATLDGDAAYAQAQIIVVAVPTNYDDETNSFDTSFVEDVIALAFKVNPEALVVIKSTIPVGFTEGIAARYPEGRLVFSPEFLREGKALFDNLYPSRIIAGYPNEGAATREDAEFFAKLLAKAASLDDPPVIVMSSTEAEAVKLFANTYLATRVAFFNELDTYAELNDLNATNLIEGVTLDPRIGVAYCNPSFGYGGYCLPKDTKQLLAEFEGIPQNVVGAVVEANRTRKAFIAQRAAARVAECSTGEGTIGAYRLTMKQGSDNFRSSAIQDIIEQLRADGHDVVIYEPTLNGAEFNGFKVVGNIEEFKALCDVILANRLDACLEDVADKVYSRDCLKGC